jgi:hypothetical protein
MLLSFSLSPGGCRATDIPEGTIVIVSDSFLSLLPYTNFHNHTGLPTKKTFLIRTAVVTTRVLTDA